MTRFPFFVLIAGLAALPWAIMPLAAQTNSVAPFPMANAGPLPTVSSNATASDASLATPGATAQAADTNAAPSAPVSGQVVLDPSTGLPVPTFSSVPKSAPAPPPAAMSNSVAADLLGFGAVAGFIACYCGLTRARHCGHTCTMLLVGVMVALAGYWVGGFAVQCGGMGDAHAALAVPLGSATAGDLDHELGFLVGGRHWNLMGSAGFFLSSDADARASLSSLFLGQAVFLAAGITIAIGGALERARILAVAIVSFLSGALLFPLVANWVWGGGWLAGLGRESGLGHGVVDLAGAGVIHLTAGTLALVLAIQLGPRLGRFGRQGAPIPGHNLPFVLLGSVVVLVALTALNAVAYPGGAGEDSPAGIAATNTLLGASAGLAAGFGFALYRRQRPHPVALCRGLVGGAVAVSAGGALIESWAAVVTGAVAGAIVQAAGRLLERRQIDDPVGVVAVHGASGAWGLVALGLFANGAASGDINGVTGPVRGLLTAHDGLQLVAQVVGVIVITGVVFGIGYAFVGLTHKIVGIRVEVADETSGLDEARLGVLGYQADAEPEKEA